MIGRYKKNWIRKIFVLQLLILLCFFIANLQCYADSTRNNKVTFVYFYTSVCKSCNEVNKFMQQLNALIESSGSKFSPVIKGYNIAEPHGAGIIHSYFDAYKVPEKDRKTPIVFVGNSYFVGDNQIKVGIANLVEKDHIPPTWMVDIKVEKGNELFERFQTYRWFGVFLIGLINSLNPCSLSMLMFFLSILTLESINIKRIGFAYAGGKFVAYILLGTLFFNLLSKIVVDVYTGAVKIVFLLLILFISLLNINDYFAAKKEKYGKIKNQLPPVLRRLNHLLIKRLLSISGTKTVAFVGFLIGAFVSVGEFLCTGQIYLSTIVLILREDPVFNTRAMIYLFLYSIAFILPVTIITMVIHKGKELFSISEIVRSRLPLIKLLTTIFFIAVGIAYVVYF